jgi:ornithine cyclodeaminase/alanine dehydrogenase-like protein (mu-crystallin family)
MQILTIKDIEALGIPDASILQWVEEAFLSKPTSMLPHKISQTFNEGRNFFNTMPAIIPSLDAAGVKVVSRYPERTPSIMGELLLYKFSTGEPLALMDATWITAKRTGAVAALAVKTFARPDYESVAVMGLGQTGRGFLDMFLTNPENYSKKIKLLRYKHHAEDVQAELEARGCTNVQICNSHEELICDSDVIVSAITVAESQIGEDQWFKEGCLVVPIHTRGFQNCDLFFDKVFADDTSHVEGFKYFQQFKEFGEISDVLSGSRPGRQHVGERILSYNIGIALHDICIARKIHELKTTYRL